LGGDPIAANGCLASLSRDSDIVVGDERSLGRLGMTNAAAG
jgi:hypothetical protein